MLEPGLTKAAARRYNGCRKYAERGDRVRYRASFRTREGRRIILRMGVVALLGTALAAAALLAAWGVYWMFQQFMSRHQPDIGSWTYAGAAADCAGEYDVPLDVVYAVIETESHFDTDARSGAGACGLMQLMPDTYDWIRTRLGEADAAEPAEGIFDPELNLRYGIYYLSWLYETFGVWETAWAGYNAGPNIVKKWLQDSRYSSDGVTLHTIPYTETANYVVKVGEAREYYQSCLRDAG